MRPVDSLESTAVPQTTETDYESEAPCGGRSMLSKAAIDALLKLD